MNISSADFSGEIRRTAAALGRDPTGAQVASLQEELRTFCVVDPETGIVSVEIDGKTTSLPHYLTKAADAFAKLAPAEPQPAAREWVKVEIGSSTGWRRVRDPYLQVKASIDGSYDSELEAEMKIWPNPWAKGRENRTRQTVMQNKNPALAAKLKAEATR